MHIENIVKGIITLVMWALLSVISIGAVIGGSSFATSSNVEVMALGPPIIALIGTFIIWVLPDLVRNEHKENIAKLTNKEHSKGKRQSGGSDKLSLLMELMDEDERQAFKETLKQRILEDARLDADGELSYGADTLESLFYEDDANKRLERD